MNPAKSFLTLAIGALLAGTLTSCVNLRRADAPAHYYMLSTPPASPTPVSAGDSELAVGLGAVEIPSYLLDRRIAVCRGPNEIKYLEYDRWSERLDKGIQRVLAAHLAAALPSDRVLRSAWRRDDVACEIYVTISRFEIDEQGRVIVEANWRMTSPAGEKTWRAGHTRVAKEGPAFGLNPRGAVDALSQALSDLSGQIAADLRGISTTTGRQNVTEANASPEG